MLSIPRIIHDYGANLTLPTRTLHVAPISPEPGA